MDELKLPADTKLAGQLVAGHVRKEQDKVERGWIGSVLGSRPNLPGNVAAIIGLTSALVLIFGVLRWAGSDAFTTKDAVTALTGLVTLTVGFLFGRASQ